MLDQIVTLVKKKYSFAKYLNYAYQYGEDLYGLVFTRNKVPSEIKGGTMIVVNSKTSKATALPVRPQVIEALEHQGDTIKLFTIAKNSVLSQNGSNELKHFGILGMRWGVRRYQNADGSLTAKGQKRYSDDEEVAKARVSTNAKFVAKHVDSLTDEELRNRLNRIQMERALNTIASSEKSKGQQLFDTIMKAGKTANEIYALYDSPVGKLVRGTITKKIPGAKKVDDTVSKSKDTVDAVKVSADFVRDEVTSRGAFQRARTDQVNREQQNMRNMVDTMIGMRVRREAAEHVSNLVSFQESRNLADALRREPSLSNRINTLTPEAQRVLDEWRRR